MKHIRNIAIVAVLVVAVGVVVAIKQSRQPAAVTAPPVDLSAGDLKVGPPLAARRPIQTASDKQRPYMQEKIVTPSNSLLANPGAIQALPKLVDLGAGKCIPCKMMAPILEDLKKTHADKFKVEFIDVWQNPDSGRKYGIRVIPTQIFFAPDGKELFRHEGFFGKDDILAKWKELGF